MVSQTLVRRATMKTSASGPVLANDGWPAWNPLVYNPSSSPPPAFWNPMYVTFAFSHDEADWICHTRFRAESRDQNEFDVSQFLVVYRRVSEISRHQLHSSCTHTNQTHIQPRTKCQCPVLPCRHAPLSVCCQWHFCFTNNITYLLTMCPCEWLCSFQVSYKLFLNRTVQHRFAS